MPERAAGIAVKPTRGRFVPGFLFERRQILRNVFAEFGQRFAQPIRVHQHHAGIHVHVIVAHSFRRDREVLTAVRLQLWDNFGRKDDIAVGIENAIGATQPRDDLRQFHPRESAGQRRLKVRVFFLPAEIPSASRKKLRCGMIRTSRFLSQVVKSFSPPSERKCGTSEVNFCAVWTATMSVSAYSRKAVESSVRAKNQSMATRFLAVHRWQQSGR